MTILSKPVLSLGNDDFELTENDNVNKALQQVSNMSNDDMNNMFMGIMEMMNVFSSDNQELKDDIINNNNYTPNLGKSSIILTMD